MFYFIVKWIILSLSLIALIHYLYFYLIKTLTVPKVRDLIHKPQEQYNELFKNMNLNTTSLLPASINDKKEKEEELPREMYTEMNNYVASLKNSS